MAPHCGARLPMNERSVKVSDEQSVTLQDKTKTEPDAGTATPRVGCCCQQASSVASGPNSAPVTRPAAPLAAPGQPPALVPPPAEPQVPAEAVKAYIERCLKPQRAWFCRKAAGAKRFHHALISAQVLATAAIPMLNMLTLQHRNFTYLSTAAAAVSGLAAGISGFGKYREHWVRYRQTATTLENMELEYELSLAPFDGPDRNNLLINSVRKLLGDEQKLWLADVKSTGAIRSANTSGIPSAISRSNNQSDDDA